MKARIFPQGNKEKMKDNVRTYSTTAQFDSIRLLLAIVTSLKHLGVLDIIGAYMQIGPINWDMFVSPPREWDK